MFHGGDKVNNIHGRKTIQERQEMVGAFMLFHFPWQDIRRTGEASARYQSASRITDIHCIMASAAAEDSHAHIRRNMVYMEKRRVRRE